MSHTTIIVTAQRRSFLISFWVIVSFKYPPENDFLSDHFLRLYHLQQRSPVWAGPGRRFNKSLWTLAVSSLKPENSPNNLISLRKQNKFNYTTHFQSLFSTFSFCYLYVLFSRMNKWYFFQNLDDDDFRSPGPDSLLKKPLAIILFHLFSKRNIPISLEMKDTKMNVINT